MRYLFLMSGLPGSGKSEWCRQFLKRAEPETAIWHSRDIVRFQMVKEKEEYFSREGEVFDTWIETIQKSINTGKQYILVDATHINDRSRQQTLSHLDIPDNVEVVNVVFDVPLSICMQRNLRRTGRECVPEKVIKRMNYGFTMPNTENKTIIIDERGWNNDLAYLRLAF